MNKEQLKQQLEEMRAKVSEMEQELNKPDKFEWEYKEGDTYHVGAYSVYPNPVGINIDCDVTHGRYRIKEANAKLALQRNKEANLIEALAEQISPYWVADWSDKNQGKHWIFLASDTYEFDTDYEFKIVGTPYMSREAAERICEMLNNGEVEL